MYALLGFLAALNLFLVARFVAGQTDRLGWSFFAVNAAMLATHYYAVFMIAIELPILFFLKTNRLRAWLPALIASCSLFIGPLLAAKYLATPHAGGSYDGMGIIALPGMVWAMLTGYTLMPSSADLHRFGLRAALAYLPAAFVMLFALAFTAWGSLRSLPKPSWILLLGLLLGILLGPLVISFAFDIGINPRYAMTGVPSLFVFLGAGLATLIQWRFGWVVALSLFVVTLFASYLHLEDPGHGREDVITASKWLNQNVPTDEPILITSEELAILARFHWPQRSFFVYPPRRTIVERDNLDTVTQELPFVQRPRVIFMIGREWLSDPRDMLAEALQKRYKDCGGTTVRGIRILCLTTHGEVKTP